MSVAAPESLPIVVLFWRRQRFRRPVFIATPPRPGPMWVPDKRDEQPIAAAPSTTS